MFGGRKESPMGALSVVPCAVLDSTTCVLCQRCSVFSLSSVNDGADTGPQNIYHQQHHPECLVLFCLGFDSCS